jgi:serine/threonine protein kinase
MGYWSHNIYAVNFSNNFLILNANFSLSGYAPFSPNSKGPISPGMITRIKTGKYNLSGVEWDRVSEAGKKNQLRKMVMTETNLAKNLIRGCLTPDPLQRTTIEEILTHKWIVYYYNKNPDVSLPTNNSNVPLPTPKKLSNQQTTDLSVINFKFSTLFI